jgi:hypothetical protein
MLLDADRTRTSNELGEDTCELFELIEHSFGVQFGDYNGLLGKSVEEIAQLVAERSSFPPSERCLSQAVFYVFREAFVSSLGLSRGSIRPGSRLSTLLPWRTRRAHWAVLQKQLQIELPNLTGPTWLFFGSLIFLGIGGSLLLMWAWPGLTLANALAWTVLPAIAAWIGLLHALVPFCRMFPRGCETLGDLVRIALGRNYSKLAARYGGTNGKDISVFLTQLITAWIGAEPDRVTPKTRIPEGLNIY